MIFRPKLPPRAGYVEVELNGKRVHVSVATGKPLGEEGEKPNLHRVAESVTGLEDALCEVDAMGEERAAGLEEALCELDAANEVWKAGVEEALCELDGLVNGLALVM